MYDSDVVIHDSYIKSRHEVIATPAYSELFIMVNGSDLREP